MKVDLISNVSHDLKTPLTSIVGYLELMKKEELDDVVSDYVEVISQKSQKLKEMIDSLFDLAKTSSGNVELKMEVLELNRLVEQVEADMAEFMGRYQGTMEFSAKGTPNFVFRYKKYGLVEKEAELMMEHTNRVLEDMAGLYE